MSSAWARRAMISCRIALSTCLLRLLVGRVLARPATELLQFQAVGMRPLVLGGGGVAPLAGATGERDDVAHGRYSAISVTTPAPTVRPPSRIANRHSFSIPPRLLNSIAHATLSPAIPLPPPLPHAHPPLT